MKHTAVLKFVSENWERVFFSVVGLVLIGYSLRLVYMDQMPNAGVVFGLGFLSFIYANLSRFKRFKGLGFEAELWEDKQKEAEHLIQRLKNVVSIYTKELVLGQVRAGRWGSGVNWKSRWQLYYDLVAQHGDLGQKIDFSSLKKSMDDYFLFDLTLPLKGKITDAITEGRRVAMNKINQEFGSPVKDAKGYGTRVQQIHALPVKVEEPFEVSTKGDLAGQTLKVWRDAKEHLKQHFDVDADVDPKVIERLEAISKLYQSRPVNVTDELIAWADQTDT